MEVEASRDRLIGEREDLTEAIKRLRQAIQNLNLMFGYDEDLGITT